MSAKEKERSRKIEELARQAGYDPEKNLEEATRSAPPIPSIKREKTAEGSRLFIKYPPDEDNPEEKIKYFKGSSVEVAIVDVKPIFSMSEQGDLANKIYFEIDGKVVIDKRSDIQIVRNQKGNPQKRLIIGLLDPDGVPTEAVLYLSVTDLKALDSVAKKIKAAGTNFGKTTVLLQHSISKRASFVWVGISWDIGTQFSKMSSEDYDLWAQCFEKTFAYLSAEKDAYGSRENTNAYKSPQAEDVPATDDY